jgi:hypothetical protein
MTEATVWRTDDACPVCEAGLFLIGCGQPVQIIECWSCGWSERWDLSDDVTGVVPGDQGR